MKWEIVWNAVEYWWESSLKLDVIKRSTSELELKQEWDKIDNEVRTMLEPFFSIFNGVSPNEFCRIATCKRAKKAWDILQVTYEGTSIVKLFNYKCWSLGMKTLGCKRIRLFLHFILELSDIVNFFSLT